MVAGALLHVGMLSSEKELPYRQDGQYFFGETYTTIKNKIHVVTAAKLILGVELFLLFFYVVIIPLTIGFFDTISLFQLLVSGSIWIMAVIALHRYNYNLLWPLIVLKICEIILLVFLLVIAVLLALIRRRILLGLLQWRITTINQSNQGVHIIALILFIILQLFYNTLAVQGIYNVFEYYRQRTIFMYNQERRKVHQLFI